MIFRIEKWKNHFSHEFPQGPLWTSRTQRWQQVLRLLPKKATHVAKNFRSCKGCSQLSVDIFMASGDLLVAQKSYLFQKSLQKTRDTVNPPPLISWLRDMYTSKLQKMGQKIDFFRIFEKCTRSTPDIVKALKMGLRHPKCIFPAIYRPYEHVYPLWKNHDFWSKIAILGIFGYFWPYS